MSSSTKNLNALKLLWTTYVCHISFQSTQTGTYRHQVMHMFLLHKMVHIQLEHECKSTMKHCRFLY